MKKIFLAMAPLFIFYSCSSFRGINVEKRHYKKGFFVHVVRKANAGDVAFSGTPGHVSQPEHFKMRFAGPLSVSPRQTAPASAASSFTSAAQPVLKKMTTFSREKAVGQAPSTQTKHEAITAVVQKRVPGHLPAMPDDTDQAILIILAIFLSPLAVFLKEGSATNHFWLDLICWLLGVAVFGFFFFSGLLWLFAVIYALLIVLGKV